MVQAHLIIDLAFISCQSSLCSCSTILPLGTSDHYGFELALKWKLPSVSKTQPITIWRYDHADFQIANELLETVDWESLIVDDIDVAWQNWEIKFMSIMDQCVPETTLPAKKYLPWLSKELTKSIHVKCAKRTGASQHFLSYKRKRNEVVKLMKKAKRKFFQGLNTPNSKNFLKVATFLSKKNSSIPTLKNRETVVENDLDKVTLLNRYFHQCFNQSVSPLTDNNISMFDSTNPLLCPEEFLCTEDEVLEMLLSLDTKKGNGWDSISARML